MLMPSKLVGVSDFVKWYRSKHDLQGVELAKELKLSKQHIHQIEQGDYFYPQNFIKRICTILTKEEKEILVEALSRSIREQIVK